MSTLEITIEPSVNPNDEFKAALERTFTAMHLVVPLERFDFVRTAPGVFNYIITAVDGRVFRSALTFTAGQETNPSVTFNQVTGAWREQTELPKHRDLRRAAIDYYRQYTDVESVRIELS